MDSIMNDTLERLPLIGEQVVQAGTGVIMSVVSFNRFKVTIRPIRGRTFTTPLVSLWDFYSPKTYTN